MYCVMLVEDDEVQARLMHDLLKVNHADEVLVCPTLTCALGIIPRNPEFTAIVLDLNLPDSKGIDTYYEVKRVTSMPVFVLAGADIPELHELVQVCGDRYFIKPDAVGAAKAVAGAIYYKHYEETA